MDNRYSEMFIAHVRVVAALLRETVKQVDAAVKFEVDRLKDIAAAENRPVRPADYDKLNCAYDFRDRLQKLYVMAETFIERYGIKSMYQNEKKLTIRQWFDRTVFVMPVNRIFIMNDTYHITGNGYTDADSIVNDFGDMVFDECDFAAFAYERPMEGDKNCVALTGHVNITFYCSGYGDRLIENEEGKWRLMR